MLRARAASGPVDVWKFTSGRPHSSRRACSTVSAFGGLPSPRQAERCGMLQHTKSSALALPTAGT
jgi:hypothetical protein